MDENVVEMKSTHPYPIQSLSLFNSILIHPRENNIHWVFSWPMYTTTTLLHKVFILITWLTKLLSVKKFINSHQIIKDYPLYIEKKNDTILRSNNKNYLLYCIFDFKNCKMKFQSLNFFWFQKKNKKKYWIIRKECDSYTCKRRQHRSIVC